jgi:hypothetical protein
VVGFLCKSAPSIEKWQVPRVRGQRTRTDDEHLEHQSPARADIPARRKPLARDRRIPTIETAFIFGGARFSYSIYQRKIAGRDLPRLNDFSRPARSALPAWQHNNVDRLAIFRALTSRGERNSTSFAACVIRINLKTEIARSIVCLGRTPHDFVILTGSLLKVI